MPNLGDYLGQILSEITLARMQADIETIRLAEIYAAHPLLRTLPVPHVRLPEVDLDIPVIIKSSEQPGAGQSLRGGTSLAAMRKKFDDILVTHLAKAGTPLTQALAPKLKAALDDRLTRHGLPTESAIDVNRVADDLAATAVRILGEVDPATSAAPIPSAAPPSAAQAEMEKQLKAEVRLEFLKMRKPPPRLVALVTSAELREAGPAENLTRLKLKVTEQGLEWTSYEAGGAELDRLVPE